MYLVLILWVVVFTVFILVNGGYYLYLYVVSKKKWNLIKDQNYLPSVTIIVPFYNEGEVIKLKLENLAKIKYPREKLQILMVNDASTDNSLNEVLNFKRASNLEFTVINNNTRQGKNGSLNKALLYAKGDIIVVTDADAFLSPDILYQTMPYFADPSIGAIISREDLLKPDNSWVSKTEKAYFNLVYGLIKLAESKIYSTIIFHGGFAAYRRSLLPNFNIESDDAGTALDVVQMGKRTIIVPDAVSFCFEFSVWRDKFKIKVRRAMHNIKIWLRCLRLIFKHQLRLPKTIAIPEIFIYIFNPLILLFLLIVGVILSINYTSILLIPLSFAIFLVVPKLRLLCLEFIQSNVFLLCAMMILIFKRGIICWETVQNPRKLIKREMLEQYNLV
jgi:cellulose synthase/poly-beta-1,6-N-acetylglucosamine synthase-like glycosyltransferase